MRKLLIFMPLILLVGACANELDPILKGPPIPVIYALLDAEDSVARVRLSKTFTLESGFERDEIPSDSLLFPEARVWLERWNGDYLYLRSELISSDLAREPGQFPYSPNPVYHLPLNEETSRIFEAPKYRGIDLIKLIVEIPNYPLIYSQVEPLPTPNLKFPKEGSRVNFFGATGFSPTWSSGKGVHYTEGYLGVEYTDHYADSDSLRIVRWREYHADVSMTNPSPFLVHGEDFLRRVGHHIKEDPLVKYRSLEKIWIYIYCTDQNFYEYLVRSRISPVDQTGLPFSNLVNGIGLFAATATVKRACLPGYFTMSQVANSEFTKHLRFSAW